MTRPSGGLVLVAAVLAAVLATVITAATAGAEAVARREPATRATVTTAAGPTHADVTRDARGERRAETVRHAISHASERERRLPTTANPWGPPPDVASPARSTTTLAVAHSTSPPPSPAVFRGRNHVWIPSLGISRSVQAFPCSRARPPGAGLYRWGCAGRNNVYLMSHAWSTFKPLHDAYVHSRLRKGMKVWYADGAGRIRQFRVIWWRVTAPTTAAAWAWAAQGRSSMTLQTCVGARSQRRLIVRLVQVG